MDGTEVVGGHGEMCAGAEPALEMTMMMLARQLGEAPGYAPGP